MGIVLEIMPVAFLTQHGTRIELYKLLGLLIYIMVASILIILGIREMKVGITLETGNAGKQEENFDEE
jgi:hypothetical protein